MKKLCYVLLVIAILSGVFAAGSRHGLQMALSGKNSPGSSVLYFVDPMNPAHTSAEPGLAPCGMKMEPVYAEEAGKPQLRNSGTTLPAGIVNLSVAKQQLAGIQTSTVKRTSVQHTLRLLGKVAVDETRVYRINAAVDGRITKTLAYGPGSFVKKQDTLAAYYSPEFLRAGQALLFALKARDMISSLPQYVPAQANSLSPSNAFNSLSSSYTNQVQGMDYSGQLSQYDVTIKQNADALRNLGMGERQVEELLHTRKPLDDIDLTAPADGFILGRNASLGQIIEKGAELFRIADLSQVWILADLFETEADYIQPGLKVSVALTHQKKTVTATASQVLPQYDSSSRAMKVRLEVENLDFALRPGMLVDVDFPLRLPPTIMVSADAVRDTGLRRTVYVHQGEGRFEPRAVITGRHFGGEVEILEGLEAGDEIVVAGNFLVDSESRMKLAASSMPGRPAKDLVCGMRVDEAKA
ncbi:MAG: efflux RND transporter periplasmic adaptor subunit [Verrucomicrobia bacterium]|nr:efflux RND transporter periplasmic adaptor subunit [Verrucomicrobiota bacterium]